MIDGVHTTLTNVDALQINEITIEYNIITYLYGHSNAQLETCASWPSTLLQSNKGAYHTSKSAVLLICYEAESVESRKSNINLRGDIIYNVQLAYKWTLGCSSAIYPVNLISVNIITISIHSLE